MRYKVAIRFAIGGDLRFISHHDTMRLFERALSRSQLPVKYSEGFNPRPKLSLPLPRAVGVASDADVLVVEFSVPVDAAAVLDALSRQMPEGLKLQDAWVIDGGRTLQVERVQYELSVPEDSIESAGNMLVSLMASGTWPVERTGTANRDAKVIDVRAFLVDARVEEGILRWTASVSNDGTVRPVELLKALGLSPEQLQHKVRRIAIAFSEDKPRMDEPALAQG